MSFRSTTRSFHRSAHSLGVRRWHRRIRDTSIAYMNMPAPELSPLFRSDAQGEILARLLLSPQQRFTVAELARLTGTSYASTHRETQRLLRTQVIVEQRVGRHHQFLANPQSPAFEPLCALVRLSYGPVSVLPRALAGVDGVRAAYLYGSWAARRSGEPGGPPRDLDVLVVGDPSRAQLFDAAERAEAELGRDVNIRVVSESAWAEPADDFLRTLQDRPLVRLHLPDPR